MKREAGIGRGLQIRLLGELALFRQGRALPLPPSKKTRALLAYLAVTGKAQLREHLCALLWDGPDDPRAQLRWSLSKLRPLLDEGKQRLHADRERIGLSADDLEVDVARVQAAAGRGVAEMESDALVNLATCFAGTFLDGLELTSCYRFHGWCVAQREQLHSTHVAVVTTLLGRLRGQPAAALPHARTLLALDPLAESSHATVVRLLGELGRPREALEQYEHWRKLVARELDGTPSREMEALRMAIGKRSAAAALPAASSTAPAAASAPARIPFVGRVAELAMLERSVAAAAAGQGHEVVLLLGDPGMGKSRLLEELATRVRKRGGQVVAGRAFEAELLRPYGAFIDALRGAGELVPPVPELRAPADEPATSGPSRRPADRNPMFEWATAALGALARTRGPLVVLLDDIQWLDEASAALLHFVARALDEQPVLLACAAREGELPDNPNVLRLLRALEREHRLRHIALSPLDQAAVVELVAAVRREADPQAVLAGCEGNPLFAIEMARARPAEEGGGSPTLRALIDGRLERLEERARGLLAFAAALGRGFDPQVLASALAMPATDLFAVLGDLERRGILRASGPGSYDFSHDLIRQAAYRQLSAPRRRLVHLHLARVLATWPDPEGELCGDLAHHAALGGDHEAAARAYLAAAQRSVRLFAWGEASELGRRGIEQLPSLERSTRLHLHVELLGAEVMGKLGPERAREVDLELLRALSAAEDAGLHKVAARGYYLRSVLQFRSENEGAAVETSWRAIRAGRDADALTAARSQAEAGRCLMLLERDIGKAKELLEGAYAVLSGDEDDLRLTWGLGLLSRYVGESEQATERLGRAATLARHIDSHWEETECLRALTLLALEQGKVAAARAHCPPLLALADKMGAGSERPIAEALDGLCRVLAGDAGAQGALAQALDGLRAADAKAMLATILNFAAEHDLAEGHLARAEARATEALAAARAVDRANQAAIAEALLARLALRAAPPDGARVRIEPLRAALPDRFALSAYARAAVSRALAEFTQPPGTKAIAGPKADASARPAPPRHRNGDRHAIPARRVRSRSSHQQ